MKFSCDKAVLSAAVSNVSRAVTTRTALQALEGILIRAEGDTLTLTGYDLELGITTVIPAGRRRGICSKRRQAAHRDPGRRRRIHHSGHGCR